MNRITPKTMSVAVRAAALLFVFTVGVALATSGDAWAKRHSAASLADPVATATITTCGTYTGVSGNPTIYLVTQDITTSSTGNCITLGGSDNTLALQGHNITGPGSGTSRGDVIVIQSFANDDVIEGGGGIISGFAVGVFDKGSNTVGDAVEASENGIGMELTGGTVMWTNVNSTNNTAQGIYLNGCSDECGISDFNAGSNGADGVLVIGSEAPRISVFFATDNGGAGVHVGCASDCDDNSEVNVSDAVMAIPSVTGNKGDGIFLDASESNNKDKVYLVSARGNGITSGSDLHDATSTCGLNQWVTNDYVTAKAAGVTSPSCIPLGF